SDAVDGSGEYAVTFHRLVVGFLQPIEMDVEEKAAGGPKFVQALADEHAVGAEVDVPSPFEDAPDQLAEFGVDHRFPTANAHDGGAALLHRGETLGYAELLPDGLGVLANSAAAGAGQVAGVQWLQHQDQGKTLLPGQLLAGDISRHAGRECQGETHILSRSQ